MERFTEQHCVTSFQDNAYKKPAVTTLWSTSGIHSWEEMRIECLYIKSQNVRHDLSDGQDGFLSLPPPLVLLLQLACGFGKEHHILFALDLPLQELKRCAVEAHHVLRQRGRCDEEEKQQREEENTLNTQLFVL